MNEQLQQALTSLIKRLSDVTDVATAQVPQLVREMIAYQIMDTWLWTGYYVALLIASTVYIIWYIKTAMIAKKFHDLDEPWTGLAACVMGMISAVTWITCLYQSVLCATLLVKLYNYPNVWVVSYLRGML